MEGNTNTEMLTELLEIYMELVEKQDAAIYYMDRVIKNQQEVIQNLREGAEFPDCANPLAEEERICVEEALKEYGDLKDAEMRET